MDSYDEIMRLYDVSVNQSKENKELKNTIAELKDALEFEARVAIVLAQFAETNAFDCPTCPLGFDCTKESEDFCVWRILKEARLAVEAEMDK